MSRAVAFVNAYRAAPDIESRPPSGQVAPCGNCGAPCTPYVDNEWGSVWITCDRCHASELVKRRPPPMSTTTRAVLVKSPKAGSRGVARGVRMQQVLTLLADRQWHTAPDIGQTIGISWTTAKDVLARLVKWGRVESERYQKPCTPDNYRGWAWAIRYRLTAEETAPQPL